MRVVVEFDPRPDYGRTTPLIKDTGKLGWRVNVRKNLLNLRSDIKLGANTNAGLSASLTLKVGEALAFSLTFSGESPAVLTPLGDAVAEKLNLTIDWWCSWAAKSNYHGLYERSVIRSALVLKLLS